MMAHASQSFMVLANVMQDPKSIKMRVATPQKTATPDLSSRYFYYACGSVFIGIPLLMGILWHVFSDSRAHAETISSSLRDINLECRNFGSTAIRFEIMARARPLEEDEINEILEPILELDSEQCRKMNEQVAAAKVD